jgi:hypothetical protein
VWWFVSIYCDYSMSMSGELPGRRRAHAAKANHDDVRPHGASRLEPIMPARQ